MDDELTEAGIRARDRQRGLPGSACVVLALVLGVSVPGCLGYWIYHGLTMPCGAPVEGLELGQTVDEAIAAMGEPPVAAFEYEGGLHLHWHGGLEMVSRVEPRFRESTPEDPVVVGTRASWSYYYSRVQLLFSRRGHLVAHVTSEQSRCIATSLGPFDGPAISAIPADVYDALVDL